jgi:hypothetical protein
MRAMNRSTNPPDCAAATAASSPIYFPVGAPSRLPADGGVFCAAEDRFGLAQQLPAVLMQGAILPGQLLGRILHHLPTAFVKILALIHQLLTRVDQVIRDFFSLAA